MADTTQVLTRAQHLERIKSLALKLSNRQFKSQEEFLEAKKELLNFAAEYGLPKGLNEIQLSKLVISQIEALLQDETTGTTVPTNLPQLLKELEAGQEELERQQIGKQYNLPTLQEQLRKQESFRATLIRQFKIKGLQPNQAVSAADQVMKDMALSTNGVSVQKLENFISEAAGQYLPQPRALQMADQLIKEPVAPASAAKPEAAVASAVPPELSRAQTSYQPTITPSPTTSPQRADRPQVKTRQTITTRVAPAPSLIEETGKTKVAGPGPKPATSQKQEQNIPTADVASKRQASPVQKKAKTVQPQTSQSPSVQTNQATTPTSEEKTIFETQPIPTLPAKDDVLRVPIANQKHRTQDAPIKTSEGKPQLPKTAIKQEQNAFEVQDTTTTPEEPSPPSRSGFYTPGLTSPQSKDEGKQKDGGEAAQIEKMIDSAVAGLGVAPTAQSKAKRLVWNIAREVGLASKAESNSQIQERFRTSAQTAGLQPISQAKLDELTGVVREVAPVIAGQKQVDELPNLAQTGPRAATINQVVQTNLTQPAAKPTPRDLLKEQIAQQLTRLPVFKTQPEKIAPQVEQIIATIEQQPQLIKDSTPENTIQYKQTIMQIFKNIVPEPQLPQVNTFIRSSRSIFKDFSQQFGLFKTPAGQITSPVVSAGKSALSSFLQKNAGRLGTGLSKIGSWITKAGGIGAKLGKAGSWLGKILGVGGKLAGVIPGGQIIAIASTVISLAKPFLKKIFSKLQIFLGKHKDDPWSLVAGLGVAAGGIFLLPLAPVLGLTMIGAGGTWAAINMFNAFSGVLGGSQAGLSGTFNGALSGLGNLLTVFTSPAPIAGAAIIGVGGGALVLTAASVMVITTLGSAFYVPSKGNVSPFDTNSTYIKVSKTASINGQVVSGKIENELINDGTIITYTISISAENGDLSNIQASDTTTSSQESGASTVAQKEWGDIPDIYNGETHTFEYQLQTSPVSKFHDAILNNTVAVTATVTPFNPGQEPQPIEGERSSAQANLIIGSPPDQCPMGLPFSADTSYTVTQGPNGGFSHTGFQAIDYAIGSGTPILATHKGTVTTGYSSTFGFYVTIEGNCNGQTFSSTYAHLLGFSVVNGAFVNGGETLGLSDNTGYSTGPHLHYQLNGLKINQYVPAY